MSSESPSSNGQSIVADLRQISKTYYKPDGTPLVKALREVDLQIETGQYMAIMGSSGSAPGQRSRRGADANSGAPK